MKSPTFAAVYRNLVTAMRAAPPVRTERWQGVDVSRDPSSTTYELTNVVFEVDLAGVEDLDHWRGDVRPNLPWADDHFAERVCGSPLNPGAEWRNWPWASSADKHRKNDIFNHSYSERLWPRWPRHGNGGDYSGVPQRENDLRKQPNIANAGMRGIAHRYGDLQDLVELLAGEPHTRQAYIPMFFPEDTGVGDGGRKPCSLGWHFLCRDDQLGVFYPMRSVDLRRHFKDDCYLCVRLLLWVIDRCRERNPEFWNNVKPGTYGMWMSSLHVFRNDYEMLMRGEAW